MKVCHNADIIAGLLDDFNAVNAGGPYHVTTVIELHELRAQNEAEMPLTLVISRQVQALVLRRCWCRSPEHGDQEAENFQLRYAYRVAHDVRTQSARFYFLAR